MKLKFFKDAYYNGQLMFEAGKTYEVSEKDGFANRWLTRGAVKVVEELQVESAPEKIEEVIESQPMEEKVVKEEIKVENKKGRKTKSKE